MFQSKSEWSLQMDQIPANPKGDICKGPKPKVNGSRRILEELPMLPPPLGDVIALVAGSLRASSFQSGGCHFLGFWSSVHGVIRQAICRRWWQLGIFFRWLGVHWPVCRETKDSKAPGTLLVTTRLRSVVKRIKVLGLVDGRLPPATHPFVFRGQEMDLEGHYPKRSIWWT